MKLSLTHPQPPWQPHRRPCCCCGNHPRFPQTSYRSWVQGAPRQALSWEAWEPAEGWFGRSNGGRFWEVKCPPPGLASFHGGQHSRPHVTSGSHVDRLQACPAELCEPPEWPQHLPADAPTCSPQDAPASCRLRPDRGAVCAPSCRQCSPVFSCRCFSQ